MYSRSPSRINRSKGIKVKHILQICLLVAVCFWLIYQVKHSHEKKKEFDEKDAKLASNAGDGEILRLGRKDISRVTEVGRDDKINGEDDEENESDQAETRHEDDEQEREESRADEREEEEDAGKGGEDEEIDRSEEEENHEEFVDEEKDREETDEKNEGNDVNEKEDNEESEVVLEDQDHEGEKRNTHEAREEQYKADDASSEVAHDTSTVSDAENATLKHTDSERNVSQSSNQPLLDENSHETIKGTNSSDSTVSESMEHKGNLTVSEYSTSENSTALLESSDQSQVSSSLTQLKSEQSTNTTQAQNATSEDRHNEGFNSTLSLFSHANTSDLAFDKNPLDIEIVTNSTELANTTSAEVKLSLAENITHATETTVEDGDSVNAGTDDNPESNSEDNVTGGEDESSNTETANDNAGADDLHDNVDDFASSLTQEEKEYRTDTTTLPQSKLEVQNDDDIEAE